MANRIQLNEYYIQIIADSTDADFLYLLSIVDNIVATRKKDTYRCSLRKLPEVLKTLRGIESPEQLSGLAKTLLEEELRRRRVTKALKENGPDLTSDWLWPHQCLGIELAQINRRYNFYYDTRTGKTLMMLRIMYDRLKEGSAKRCLVICPSNIIQAWLNDAATHFPELKVTAVYGEAENRYAALQKPAHVVVWATNHVATGLDILKQVKFDCCVLDESSTIKSHRAKVSEAMLDLSLTIPSWYNLSATPAPNGKEEYYVQMRCVDPYVFNPARTKFVEKYFDNKSRNRNYEKLVIKPNMEKEFTALVEDYSLYVDQAVMPTSGKEWHTINFTLSGDSIVAYNTMCKDMYAEVNGVTLTASMSAAMRAKLNQITSGFIMDTEAIKTNKANRKLSLAETDIEVYRLADTGRVEALRKLLDSFENNKVVIWANYHEEFAMLNELLGSKARYIHGGTTVQEKEQYIYEEFKKGDLQYLVCHPASVGMGINLTEAHIAVYYSLNDSWEAFKQSSERIYGHKSVQPNKCHYYVLQAEGTVNEVIYGNLINKRDASSGFLEHLKARALECKVD